ncbi:1-acyl-sn-glycerol-3-phosphate acyltransferase [Tsuneonella sp. HG222]
MTGPSVLSRIARRAILALYRWKGFRISGERPAVRKFVFLGAPHTSNWDFVYFLGAIDELGLRPSFMGKHTLFKWPMTRFMHDMGGIPVDRGRRGSNYVEQAAAAIAAADDMALVVAPEGSRSSDGSWRTGFWHIARAAGVPVVPAWFDLATGRGGLGEPIWPSDDLEADLARIAAFYRSKMPACARWDRLADRAGTSPRDVAALGSAR